MPTKRRPAASPNEAYHRLSGQEVQARIGQLRKGTFKLYIGAAPGVGKTYAMLREGNDLLERGVDVVIGYLETHGRKETEDQTRALETIPRRRVVYRETELTELDAEAVLQRNPEVVLIDELAHTNAPGSTRRKRYEDIQALLEAGISVISTINVQHLESLNDTVEQLTGVRVRETVPDHVLHAAREVELIDVTPQALRKRMEEGRIYALDKVAQSLSHFFRIGNLIALRELALREIADDVDERLEAWERGGSLRGPWRTREAIFVAVTGGPGAERLIRRGFRIAYRLKADWRVAYVHAGGAEPARELRKRLDALAELTERLGGAFDIHRVPRSSRTANRLLEAADAIRATQIIVGRPHAPWWRRLFTPCVVRELLRRGRHMDVLVSGEES